MIVYVFYLITKKKLFGQSYRFLTLRYKCISNLDVMKIKITCFLFMKNYFLISFHATTSNKHIFLNLFLLIISTKTTIIIINTQRKLKF